MGEPWNGNIETARESESQTLSEPGYDGNREYENGTYGQSDYTVRERDDGSGLSDVYITSDSGKEHSHDVIDSEGNLVASYHDYLVYLRNLIYEYQIDQLLNQYQDESLSSGLTKKLVK